MVSSKEVLLQFIENVNVIKRFAKNKDIRALQDLIDFLYSHGFISDSLYDELMLDIAELSSLKGKEYEKKAKEIERKIVSLKPQSKQIGKKPVDKALINGDFYSVHNLIDFLYSHGFISDSLYDELMLDIAELSSLEGKEYEKKAKEIERKINRVLKVARRGGRNLFG